MRPMLAAMNGPDFRTFMEAFLRHAAHSCGPGVQLPLVDGDDHWPGRAAFVLLGDDPSSTSFVLTAISLAIVIVGVLVVSNAAWKTPTYNLILAWDPEAMPTDWEAGRQRFLKIR